MSGWGGRKRDDERRLDPLFEVHTFEYDEGRGTMGVFQIESSRERRGVEVGGASGGGLFIIMT